MKFYNKTIYSTDIVVKWVTNKKKENVLLYSEWGPYHGLR